MPYISKKYYPLHNVLFCFGEGLLIFLTILIISISSSGFNIQLYDLTEYIVKASIVTITFQLSLYFFDLYDHSLLATPSDIFMRLIQAFGTGLIILASLYYLFPIIIISTSTFWTSYTIICGLVIAWRVIYYFLLEKRFFSQPVLIIGTGKIASQISSEIEKKHDSSYRIAAFIGSEKPEINPHNAPVLKNTDALFESINEYKIVRIIVALDDRRGAMPIKGLLHCKTQGISIEDGISFFEYMTGRIAVENVNPAWLIFSDGFYQSRSCRFFKRLLDITLSLAGLIVFLPLSLLIALSIKIESAGPVFYVQERVGVRGNQFRIIKFRSMFQNAEKEGAVWTKEDDSRVTRIGRIIRKLRLDEIPQMWNVLTGDMSLVGPRPERPVFVERLTFNIPYYSLRHAIKPGITGWAQICYPYGASEEDALRKLEYDLYYIKNMSITFDLLVIFRTIKTVLSRKGSR